MIHNSSCPLCWTCCRWSQAHKDQMQATMPSSRPTHAQSSSPHASPPPIPPAPSPPVPASPSPSLQAEFTSLAEWVREKTMFDLISSIGFFKHYLTGRAFRRWHKVRARPPFAPRPISCAPKEPFVFCLFVMPFCLPHAPLCVPFCASCPHCHHPALCCEAVSSGPHPSRVCPHLPSLSTSLHSLPLSTPSCRACARRTSTACAGPLRAACLRPSPRSLPTLGRSGLRLRSCAACPSQQPPPPTCTSCRSGQTCRWGVGVVRGW